jgi:hypothetical protein
MPAMKVAAKARAGRVITIAYPLTLMLQVEKAGAVAPESSM